MSYNIGLNVVEVDGGGAPAIVGAATSVAAFNIATARGVPNTPARVNSFAEFQSRFGGFLPDAVGAFLVKGFFDNGGREAWINRVVSPDPTTGAAPAEITLSDGSDDTLRLRGGFRGSADPGSWGNDLWVRVTHSSSASTRLAETSAATVSSGDIAGTVDMSGATFPSLDVTVDGEATATSLTFSAGNFADPTAATLEEIRDRINGQTTKLVASITGAAPRQLVLTSMGAVATLSGGFTRLDVAANATLAFGAVTDDGDAAALTANGTTLHATDGFSVGDAVALVEGGTRRVTKLMSVNETSGVVTWAPAIVPADFANTRDVRLETVEFGIEIALGGDDEDHVVETWTDLSMEDDADNYVVTALNDPLAGSRYVVADDEDSTTGVGDDRPSASTTFTRFTPGRDGTATGLDYIGDESQRTGFHAFDPYAVQLVTTERTDIPVVQAALTYCQNRNDCMFVGAVPEGSVAGGTAIAHGQALMGKKVYGALYGPWVFVVDPIGSGPNPLRLVPPVGHIMGVYARIESTRGIWKAPAGDEARLRNVIDVAHRMSDREHTQHVKEGAVNGVRPVPRAGIVVDASRTLSTDTRWLYVNVRLLFNYVKSSLLAGLRWVRQEPNRGFLWGQIKHSSITPFLLGLWRQGAFGTGAPDQTFTVICDESNNPPDEVEKGNLVVEVYMYPSRPAETIVIKVGQQPSGGFASDA